jgi:thymidine phosphorylase
MNFLALIESKRAGQSLAPDQIQEFVAAFTAGKIPDYQMSAMLMAIFFRGLNVDETRALTLAMRDSGDVLTFPKDKRPIVDKHSTGGIGDKVSLPLAPLLACLGFRVPMISGRGLGITGGTLDKLDSIPGFQTLRSAEKIVAQVQKVGCVICGQTDRMVPADKKLYALRDASGTVPSIALIVASILSKKLAESLDALVLDVKFGSAAFMQTKADARKLAQAMVTLGTECGVSMRALLTDMNTPLGCAAGNWLEVKESIECLESRTGVSPVQPALQRGPVGAKGAAPTSSARAGETPALPCDLRSLVIDCAAHLLVQTHKARSLAAARQQAEACLDSGAPRRKWDEMLAAQGADLSAFNQKLALDHTARIVVDLKSPRAGYVAKCDARLIGEVIRDLGGGRLTKDSVINFDVGVDRMAKPGDRVEHGSTLARIHAGDRGQAKSAVSRLAAAFALSAKPIRPRPLVQGLIL